MGMKLRSVQRELILAVLWVSVAAGPAAAQLSQKLEALDQELVSLYDGRVVSLDECIRVAEVGSATLGGFEEDLRNTAIDERAALAAFLPNLSASGFWQRQQRTDVDQAVFETAFFPLVDTGGDSLFIASSIPSGQTEDVTIFQTFNGLTARTAWTVFSGFSRFAERNRAAAAHDASEATLGYQRQLLVESVTNAYLDLLGAKQRVQVAEESQALAAKELERSETYFDLGISTRSDVLQAKVRHQQTKLDLVRERNAERNSFAALAHLMNIPSAERFPVDEELPDIRGLGVPDLERTLARAKDRRLDLVASRDNLDARRSSVTAARAGYYPSVEIFATANRNVSKTPFRFGGTKNISYTWGIQGQWNLFDRFVTKQQSRRAVAERRRAEYNLRQAQLDLELEIVQLHNNLVDSLEGYQVSSVTVERSQEDLRLAEERFRVGAGTSLDVITAQVNLSQARRDLVNAQIDYLKFRNQLQRAAGGSLE